MANLPTYAKVLIGVGLLVGLLAAFFITYIINKRTKVPDNCPKVEVGCKGCMLNCSRREEELSISDLTKNMVEGYKEDKKENLDELNDKGGNK